ncbi:MAG: MFS transporter [Planctomycetales bacterium]|nr:MFS transporter [Planctomycetales bacterium]
MRQPLRKDLTAGHAEGAAFGAMVGLGETYLPAFALAAGLGEVTAGLVASVPLVAGGLMQLVSPLAIRWLRSYRRWVLICATLQACSFLPLVYAALSGVISAAGILVVATVYWGTGLAAGPGWNTWMGGLVPRSIRARFFARRTRLSQAAVMMGVLAAGVVLNQAARHSGERTAPLWIFAVLFGAAAGFRLVSALMLTLQREPATLAGTMRRIRPREVWPALRRGGGGRLLLYLVAVQGAVQFSGPYFTPFMFEKLRLSYMAYVMLIAASFLTKIIFLPLWGHFAHRVGAQRLLWIGGVGIVPISAMWIFGDHFAWLLTIQLVGGVAWAAYELAFFLMFFESIAEDERTSVLTLYNLANTTSWVLGSLLGGWLLTQMGATHAAYLWLFGLSSVGRGAALWLLSKVPATEVEAAPIGVRTVAVRPAGNAMDAPILPSMPDQTHDATAVELANAS